MRGATTDTAARVALSGLPGLGPARLARLVHRFGGNAAAWAAIAQGRLRPGELDGGVTAERLGEWRTAAAAMSAEQRLAEVRALGIDVLTPSDPGWPAVFHSDPEPPSVLYVQGELRALDTVSVAIVGTRRATALGRAVARDLGRDLTAAGVAVVSGLALGIDGAAHDGVLRAGGAPVGVVATGLDVVYPRRHAQLWADVADAGVLLSESAPGIGPERWRFPARNRLMAALAEAVVVIESGHDGGSMRTVESAMERGTDVLAVPGAVRLAVADGPNQLLAEGAGVVRDADDVLAALGDRAPGRVASGPPLRHASDAGDGEAGGVQPDPVVEAIGFVATTAEQITEVCGLGVGETLRRLAVLELQGVIRRVDGGFVRAV